MEKCFEEQQKIQNRKWEEAKSDYLCQCLAPEKKEKKIAKLLRNKNGG